jgi:Na+-transporting NADH:ubiquinone oxidoreductase subunit F
MSAVVPVALASAFATGLVILVLVGILMVAREKLTATGEVEVIVNGDEDRPLKTEPGTTLLSALAKHALFLPSACGGGGTCALCRCQVLEGGGEVLPTETNHLSRREVADHWRLACQIKVRQDLKVRVPDEVFGIRKWECEVVSNDNVATFIKELVLRLPEGETLDFRPGGYIQIDVPPCRVRFGDFDVQERFRSDWDKFGMWDLEMVNQEPVFRAYSMANHPAEGSRIMLNIRIATPPFDRAKGGWTDLNPGVCSSYVFSLAPGDRVSVSGPFGEFFIKETDREMVYIGGGAGMAPLRSHIFHLFHTLGTSRKVSYWYGGRSLRELFYTDDFRAIETLFPNFRYHIALSEPLPDDGWEGPTGFIHQVLLDQYLSQHAEPEEVEYYLCGPPMMLGACLEMLDRLGVPREHIAFDDFGG